MPDKIQIIIEYYNQEERFVEGTKIEKNGTAKRFREKGVSVDEFKKLVRKKFGNEVDIINKVQKHRDVQFGGGNSSGPSLSSKGERLTEKDIKDLMKNKMED